MINIVIIAHSEIAHSFAYCVEHILNKRIDNLHIVAVKKAEDTDDVLARARELLDKTEDNQGILILSDLFGATPYNIAQRLVVPGKIELISGLNLPMLIRAISYAKSDLATVIAKALEGGTAGIVHFDDDE
ncbi:MAG: PTS sugar transporter subunit IIB [Burkholderiales bacterium]|nr:PTS sugar transporter subunit IIB [Burkholderiales bacterium]